MNSLMAYLPESKPTVEASAALMRELESIAAEAREALQYVRGRRKYDFQSRSGWLELQAAMVSDPALVNLPGEVFGRLTRCCHRWLSLYRHLRFVASTRPVWNS